MKKLYLVDVSSMYFRAFYAIRHLTNSKGMPTNALFGFLSMSVKLLREIRPDYMVYCFDRKEPSFRVDMDPNYKANRSEMPDDLQRQVPYISRLTGALGIPMMDRKGYEADDIIGSLTKFGRKHNLEVVIVSGDKDFGQLVDPSVKIYDTMKEITYDSEGVKERMGVPPDKVIDYLAIVGDSSDNVPGVAGIGPKGAVKLLTTYESLEDVYEHLVDIKPDGVRKKLEDSREAAFLSKKLVTIVTDLDPGVPLEDLRMKPVKRDELGALLKELEFKTLERQLLGSPTDQTASSATTSGANTTSGAVLDAASTSGEAGTSLATVAQVSAGHEKKNIKETQYTLGDLEKTLKQNEKMWAFFGPRGLSFGRENEAFTVDGTPEKMSAFFDGKNVSWLGYDLKEYFKNLKFKNPNVEWDQMLAAYVLRPGVVGTFEENYAKYVGPGLVELPSTSQLYRSHLELKEALESRLTTMGGDKVLREMELPLIPVLYRMEARGVLIDSEILGEQSRVLGKELKAIEAAIHSDAGEVFNIASPKQLGLILFEKLKLPPSRKTKTGYSTDSDVLEKLGSQHAIAAKIVEYREISKLRSTYIDALPQMVNPDTGRVHTHFNQAHTATGRLSSMNPNLQNIPIRTVRGAAIRKAFVAPKGRTLISADYSQIELRVLAHITGDPGLTKAFQDDLDVHTATAAEVFGVSLKDVTPDLRRTAKAVNFGIAYGMGAFGLAGNLGVDRKEAADIIDRYFKKFAKVREYMDSIVVTAKKTGYVETLFGRRRYIDEIHSKNRNIQQFGERAAINAPMQGTASDIVKKAMIAMEGKVNADMILQVHDELVYEAAPEAAESEKKRIVSGMQDVVTLHVPLKVDAGIGPRWSDIQ